MPKATISHDHIKYDLTSCPGGWVRLRKLTYEEVLTRRDGATRLSLEAEQRNEANGNPTKMELETLQVWSRRFEFRACIVEHNLEDENEQLLDFKNEMTFKSLEPRIALEIERLIDKVNGEDTEEALQDFTGALSSLSGDEQTMPLESSVEIES